MKIVALIAGLVFIALGIAGFAGKIAMLPMYATVLVAAGAMFAIYGISRRRDLTPPNPSGHDLRPWV